MREETKQPVALSTIYRLLDRHGWRQLGAGASSPQPLASKLTQGNMVSAPERREQSPPKGKPAQGNTVPGRQREERPTPKARSQLSAQSYPSDLTDQEWAILEPLIPSAKEGGRPRTTDMHEVLNAILDVDRTGCQWRALPHDFPRLHDRVELLSQVAQ